MGATGLNPFLPLHTSLSDSSSAKIEFLTIIILQNSRGSLAHSRERWITEKYDCTFNSGRPFLLKHKNFLVETDCIETLPSIFKGLMYNWPRKKYYVIIKIIQLKKNSVFSYVLSIEYIHISIEHGTISFKEQCPKRIKLSDLFTTFYVDVRKLFVFVFIYLK